MENVNNKIDQLLNDVRTHKEAYIKANEELMNLGAVINDPAPIFVWKVIYTDHTELDQFENGKEHNFSDINLNKISQVIFEHREHIVRIYWNTGEIHCENMSRMDEGGVPICEREDKKLILFTRKRISFIDEGTLYYYRYVLGYEIDGKKYGVMIYPNNFIGLLEV